MTDLIEEIIQGFWEFVETNIENILVERRENDVYIWIGFEALDNFTDEYQHLCEEGGFEVTIQMNSIFVKASELLSGYGIDDYSIVWKKRPKNIEKRTEFGWHIL